MIDSESVKREFDFISYAKIHTELKYRNNAWWGCCPFHKEKTASFKIHADETLWMCFGCGMGGDKVDFVAAINGLSAKEDFRRILEIMGGEENKANEYVQQRRERAIKQASIPRKATIEKMQHAWQDGIQYDLKCVYAYSRHLIKCKYEKDGLKTFRWYWSNNESWHYGKGELTNGLYFAKPKKMISRTIFVVEGEKDADTIAKCGFIGASASDGGDCNAEKWKNRYTHELNGMDVIVLNDDDCLKAVNKGKLYADKVAFKIQDVVKSVKRIDITKVYENTHKKDGYDITDIADEIGIDETKARLLNIVMGGD